MYIPIGFVSIRREGMEHTITVMSRVGQEEAGGLAHYRIILAQEVQVVGVLILLPNPERHLRARGNCSCVVIWMEVQSTVDCWGRCPGFILVTATVEAHRFRNAGSGTACHMLFSPIEDFVQIFLVEAKI